MLDARLTLIDPALGAIARATTAEAIVPVACSAS
jgi:hypothetical protein